MFDMIVLGSVYVVACIPAFIIAALLPGDRSAKHVVLGWFLPPVGFYLFFAWMKSSPFNAKSAGFGALFGLVALIVCIVISIELLSFLDSLWRVPPHDPHGPWGS